MSENVEDTADPDVVQVPVIQDNLTFESRQALRLRDLEKRISSETKKKRLEWENNVERMREEFLRLYPVEGRGEEEGRDTLILKRRGSTDVLDMKKMKTLLMEYPDSHRRYKIRFNVSEFSAENVKVFTDGERIIVRATRVESGGEDDIKTERKYERKIEKPKEIDHTKLKSHLTSDGILIIEAPLPPNTLNISKSDHPSSSPAKKAPAASASSTSIRPAAEKPNPAPETLGGGIVLDRPGVPVYKEDEGLRKMLMVVDVGLGFSAKEITAMIIKENRIKIKAKHEEKTSEKLCKSKFAREYELPEKIETHSLRGGLTSEGRLYIGALCKGHAVGMSKVSAGDIVMDEINLLTENHPCNVLDLSSFPPTTPQIIASSYIASE